MRPGGGGGGGAAAAAALAHLLRAFIIPPNHGHAPPARNLWKPGIVPVRKSTLPSSFADRSRATGISGNALEL